MDEYIDRTYGHLLSGPRETVSVHFRFGGNSEVDPRIFKLMQQPSISWYTHVMQTEFHGNVVFLLFADDQAKLQELINRSQVIQGLSTLIIHEDFAHSLLLMTRCTHHIATTSTFSFWGAYLDKKQPGGGKVVFPPQFDQVHRTGGLPFSEWKTVHWRNSDKKARVHAQRQGHKAKGAMIVE